MSEVLTANPEAKSGPAPETPLHVEPSVAPKSLEQHMTDLNAWLEERRLLVVPIAVGRKTNMFANIGDWEPETHIFTFTLVPKQ